MKRGLPGLWAGPRQWSANGYSSAYFVVIVLLLGRGLGDAGGFGTGNRSCFLLNRATGGFPCVVTTVQNPHVVVTVLAKRSRHTGAFFVVRSVTVDDHVTKLWELCEARTHL